MGPVQTTAKMFDLLYFSSFTVSRKKISLPGERFVGELE
jgi:hypothetical protein